MAKHERPYSRASVEIQDAGDDHVVISLYATHRQAKDIAWHLENLVLKPMSDPQHGVRGQFREYYQDICEKIRTQLPGDETTAGS